MFLFPAIDVLRQSETAVAAKYRQVHGVAAACAWCRVVSDTSEAATRLNGYLDRFAVEENWIFGHRVIWQTGQQSGPEGVGPEDHSHCSAFVAAIALGLDIYILRPPNHAQEMLANAQMAWLEGSSESFSGPTATQAGWIALGGREALPWAVRAANEGRLVVAGYRQLPDAAGIVKPGHIVILRAQDADFRTDTGPKVTMAGDRNWRAINMAAAFASHPGAWPDGIRLFSRHTDLQTDLASDPSTGTASPAASD